MGKLITFWAPLHGCKQTASMLAIAESLASNKVSVCVTHTQPGMSDLEGMLNNRKNESYDGYISTGLNAIVKDSDMAYPDRAMIKKATYKPDESRKLYLLNGIERGGNNYDEKTQSRILNVLSHEIKDTFDYTFVDLPTFVLEKQPMSMKLMQASDLIVVCLPQNAQVINQYFENPLADRVTAAFTQSEKVAETDNFGEKVVTKKKELLLDPKKIVICMGAYDDKCNGRLNKRNISLFKGVKVVDVPYSTAYINAVSDGSVASFFAYNEKILKDDTDFYFFRDCHEAGKLISKLLG